MKSIALVLITGLLLSACGSSSYIRPSSEVWTPCTDAKYLSLKSRSLDSLTTVEAQLLGSYEIACSNQRMTDLMRQQDSQTRDGLAQVSETLWGIFWLTVVMASVGILISTSK